MPNSRVPVDTIIVDTREQRPYKWAAGQPAERETLDVGDYTGRTTRDVLRIERKDLRDLLGCVGGERDRFERCLSRLEAYPKRFLLLEVSLEILAAGPWKDFHRSRPSFAGPWANVHPDLPRHSRPITKRALRITPSQVIGSVYGWALRFGVTPLFCGDRRHAKATVARIIKIAAEQRRREREPVAPRV